MSDALLFGYIRGWSVEFLAEDIGVARSVVRKKMIDLQLPRGRWVSRKTRTVAALQASVK